MRINNNFHINNPVLHYKLDPGEPGMATPTRASQSITKVATHEGTNIRRFKREAMEKGGVVVYSNIYLNLEYKGSFLAATSGKSKALIIIPEKEKTSVQNFKIDENNNNYKITDKYIKDELDVDKKNKDESNQIDSNSSGLNNIDEVEEINDVIDRLENEKLSLEAQLSDDKTLNYKVNQNKDENIYKENRLDEIEKKIQYLEQKKELEKQKQFFSNIISSKNISLKLVNLVYNNLNLNADGTLIDTVI